MIVALEGLFDVAEGATSALHHLVKHTQAHKIATIDSEEFFDFSRERPFMSLEGGDRQILWPHTFCYAAIGGGAGVEGSGDDGRTGDGSGDDGRSEDSSSDDSRSVDGGSDDSRSLDSSSDDSQSGDGSSPAGRSGDSSSDDSRSGDSSSPASPSVNDLAASSNQPDLLLVVGVEPHLRWRAFAGCLVDIATEFGASTVVTLGSPPGHAPHTRPLGVVGSTTNRELAAQLGLGPPTYEGPTGLVGVLHEQLDKLGVPSFSLKVSVPHYVTAPPNPEASRSLLARLELITGIETGHNTFDDAADQWRERIDSAVAADEDIAHYVRKLEQEIDSTEGMMPTGSDLAQQLEAFLRGQGDAG